MERLKQFLVWFCTALGITACGLEQLLPWLLLLVMAMGMDYITGMSAAAWTGTLSSRAGLRGIAKKLACLCMVAVGVLVDSLLRAGGSFLGLQTTPPGTVTLMVVLWLIVNEILSTLENLGRMEIPLPGFLTRLVESLRQAVQQPKE